MHTSELGDHIGMESCVDLETDTEPLQSCPSKAIARKPWGTTSSRKSSMCAKKMKKLPPPLPFQSSTVMKRYYTNDGRLVITEEKVESPKYHFNAIRADGRLTLQLVEPYEPKMVRKSVVEVEEGGSKVVKSGGEGGGISYKAAVKAAATAATGSCLIVNQNRLHAIRPVHI